MNAIRMRRLPPRGEAVSPLTKGRAAARRILEDGQSDGAAEVADLLLAAFADMPISNDAIISGLALALARRAEIGDQPTADKRSERFLTVCALVEHHASAELLREEEAEAIFTPAGRA